MKLRKPHYITTLVTFSLLLVLSTFSYADLGLGSGDFQGKRVSGEKIDGKTVTGKTVTGSPVTASPVSGKPVTGTSVGSAGSVNGVCVTGGDSACSPCSDSKSPAVNSEQVSLVNSFVNLFSRKYQDDKVDMSVKVPGGFLKVVRIYQGEKWQFEHEYNRLDLSTAATGNIIQSTYTYKKRDDGLYHYKTYTIKEVGDQYRWENKKGDYVLYSKEGKMVESGNRSGAIERYTYKDNKLISIHDRNNVPIYHFQYGNNGNITKAWDEHSREVSYKWQGDKLLEVTDVLGHISSYTYNPEGQLISKSDEAGREFFITYHPDGAVQSVLSLKGGGHYFSFKQVENGGGQYAKVTSTMGNVKEFWFDASGETKKIEENDRLIREDSWRDGKKTSIDEIGSRTVKTYDKNDNLLKEEFIDGSTISYKYDSRNNLIAKINEIGVESRYINNSHGQLVKVLNAYKTPEQVTTEYDHDANGRLTSITIHKKDGSVSIFYDYDEYDNLILVTEPMGSVSEFRYDFMGNPVKSTNPMGLSTTMEYDVKGNLIAKTSPNGQSKVYTYDAAGRQITAAMKGSSPTILSYDEQDNVIKVEDSSGSVIRSNFDKDNRLTKKVDAEGKYKIFFYEGGSKRISKIIDGSGNEIDVTYRGFDNCGSCPTTFSNKPVRIEFPTFTRQFKYDHRGRLTQKSDIIDSTFLTESYTYDKAGRLLSSQDRNGRVTTLKYDSLNRLTGVIDPAEGTTNFTYNALGNLLSLQDAKGQVTRFEYDALGKKIKEIRPLGNILEFDYDQAGRLLNYRNSDGKQITYFYNKNSGLVDGYSLKKSQDDFLGQHVSFQYNDLGQLIGYDDGVTSATYELDGFGRRTKSTVDYKDFTSSHSYTYYKNGQKKSYTSPEGITHNYTYTAINKLLGIDIEGVGKINYSAFKWLQPEKVTLPGAEREDRYDALLRLTKRKTSTSTSGEIALDLGYQ